MVATKIKVIAGTVKQMSTKKIIRVRSQAKSVKSNKRKFESNVLTRTSVQKR